MTTADGSPGWTEPRLTLDPLAVLLRSRCASRAELARASGLSYETLRTYTDGRWSREQPPSEHVLAGLARAVDRDELDRAVRESLALQPAPALTSGQRAILEAVRDVDDEQLIAAAPYVHELVRDFQVEDHA